MEKVKSNTTSNSILIPGSFDPITIGHLDLIIRAAKMFEYVYVAAMINDSKKYLLTKEDRILMLNKVFGKYPNIKVVSSDSLTVELCKELNCNKILKGVRTNADFEYELNQANINMMLDENIETILMFSKPEYSSVSSSSVKSIYKFNKNIKKFIPEEIYEDVLKALEEN